MSQSTETRVSIPVANPAAGADWSLTAPTVTAANTPIVRYKVISLHCKFVASSTVANRQPTIVIKDGSGNILYQATTGAVVAASGSQTIDAGAGAQPALVGTAAMLTLPVDLILAPGWVIGSSTASIQATDQWSLITVNVAQIAE